MGDLTETNVERLSLGCLCPTAVDEVSITIILLVGTVVSGGIIYIRVAVSRSLDWVRVGF